MFVYGVLLIVSLILLFLSGDRVVEYGRKIASSIGMSRFFFAMLFVSLGTSLPEIAVSLISSFQGLPEVVVGDVLGSNVTDLLFILGIYSILLSRRLDDELQAYLSSAIAFSGIAFAYTLLREVLTFFDGLFLLFLFFLFLKDRLPSLEISRSVEKARASDYIIFVLSLITLLISAYTAVNSLVMLSKELQVPLFLASLLTLALGTSLPELAVGLSAIRRGEYQMALGDVLGSLVVNTTVGLGLAALITPVPVLLWEERFVMFLLLLSLFIVLYSLSSRRSLDKKLGVVLLLLYIAYLVTILQLI